MSPWLDTFLFGGLIGAIPLWGYGLFALVSTQLLIMNTSVYLHRGQAHKSIDVHPAIAVFCRSLFWLSQTSTVKEWVAVHRKHHRFVDTEKDPHSPWYHSLWLMLFATAYRKEAKNPDTVRLYGVGTPDDWLERHVFTRHRRMGILVLATTLTLLFGVLPGAVIWVVQVIYLPVFASWGVNGIGHRFGYRNTDTKDQSRNVLPLDPITCGELLHNNHHADPNSPKFSQKWFEFDLGWGWIRLFERFHLVAVLRHPRLKQTA